MNGSGDIHSGDAYEASSSTTNSTQRRVKKNGKPSPKAPSKKGSLMENANMKNMMAKMMQKNMSSTSDSAEDAKLNAAARKKLKTSSFALPGRRYPINDPNHARAALSMVARHGTPSEKARVRAAVHKKYPAIGKSGKSKGKGRSK